MQHRGAWLILERFLQTFATDRLNELNWLTFENKCVYYIGLLIYKCNTHLLPNYMTLLAMKHTIFFQLVEMKLRL